MIFTVTVTAFIMVLCLNCWPFALIGLWKLTLSFSLNAIGITELFCHVSAATKLARSLFT
ncbi:hypothetical protein BGZ60DRAFT_396203 [Tricladium varicosporioides]|nr:hypothetical protein BGZ60DRAFT_396203 [Hymenoscyphus varicosporioides]